MLRRLSDWIRYPGASIQYEVQRRTFRGGWKNHHKQNNAGPASYETPQPIPDIAKIRAILLVRIVA